MVVLQQLKEYEAVKDIQVAGSSKEGDQKSKGGERREKASSISRIADEITEKHKSEASTSGNMGLVKYEGGNKNALAVVSDKNRKRAPTSAGMEGCCCCFFFLLFFFFLTLVDCFTSRDN